MASGATNQTAGWLEERDILLVSRVSTDVTAAFAASDVIVEYSHQLSLKVRGLRRSEEEAAHRLQHPVHPRGVRGGTCRRHRGAADPAGRTAGSGQTLERARRGLIRRVRTWVCGGAV